LRSAEQQTLRAGEILVVDDGSTDESMAIAARHAPAVTMLRSPGRGASAARTFGASRARGEYLQFLDADDLLEPHALATRVGALARLDAEVAISDWQRRQDREGRWEPGRVESGRLPDAATPADLQIFRGFWAPPAAILYRRSVCDRIGDWHGALPVIQD